MYTSFTIENFRLFDQLTVEPLARVNLIAGQNNAGKTALLEALWLHTGQNNPELAQRISMWRGLPGSEPGELFSDLFREYQTDLPIRLIAADDNDGFGGKLAIRRQPRTEITVPMSQTFQTVSRHRGLPRESIFDSEMLFEYTDEAKNLFKSRAWVERTAVPFDLPLPPGLQAEDGVPALRTERESQSPARKNSIFLQSLSRAGAQELSARFGRAEINGHIDNVQSVLKLIEPNLKRLTAVPNSIGPPLIYADIGSKRIFPVALMGTGFVRLLELTLAFAEVGGGSILIDEIENGLHYSVLQDVWQAINDLSRRFNVQVFATTHSYECMIAARDAFIAAENDEFCIHRISRRDDGMVATTYSFDALDFTLDYGAEMR